jgi:hypothetical protein
MFVQRMKYFRVDAAVQFWNPVLVQGTAGGEEHEVAGPYPQGYW